MVRIQIESLGTRASDSRAVTSGHEDDDRHFDLEQLNSGR